MKDQVKTLMEKGVKAVFYGDVREDTEKLKNGEYSLMFFSPEGLLCNMEWREMLLSPLYQERLIAFVVDEAHCVKSFDTGIQFLFIIIFWGKCVQEGVF